MRPPRILVLRGGAVGDFICTLPALQALRARWPEAYIELLGYPGITALAFDAGLVDAIDSLDRADVAQLFSMTPRLRESRAEHLRSFDVVLSYLYDPFGTVRDNLAAAGIRDVLCGSPRVETCHAVDQLMQPLRELAIYPDETPRPCLRLGEAGVAGAAGDVAAYGSRVLAIHPGSGAPRKNWTLDGFVELARRARFELDVTPIFFAGEADEELVRRLETLATGIPLVHGRSLLEIARMLCGCVAYVGNDSGITHLAAALDLPVVALFGPTRSDLWGPRGPSVRVLTSEDRTLNGLSVDKVFDAIAQLLGDR